MKLVVFLAALASGFVLSTGAAVEGVKRDDIVEQTLELGEAVEQERAALSERDQAMLEAIVDEAIRQEELLRNRRTSSSSGNTNPNEAKDRFSGSYDHEAPPDDYGPPPIPTSYKDKSFSIWSFKKMVFNALLQAVKAITGGVIALKGQIVKVKGHLVAAKGKLLETKGDAITEFGKHLATKALLTPVHVSNFDHNTPDITGPGGPYPYPPGMPLPMMMPLPLPPPMGPYYGPPPPRPSYGRPPPVYGPPLRQNMNMMNMNMVAATPVKSSAPSSEKDASEPAPTVRSPTNFVGQLQTPWPLSPLQIEALNNLNFPQLLFGAPSSPPPVYGPPAVSAPYPASVSQSSYGSMSHSPDYVGPPPSSYGGPSSSYGGPPSSSYGGPPSSSYGGPPSSSYGAPPSAYGGPPSSHHYLPPSTSYGSPAGFSSPSGPSYPPNFGPSSVDGWNKRGAPDALKKAGLTDGVHAGLIVLKPIKSAQPQHSVYRPPQAFKKSSNSRVDEVDDRNNKKDVKT